MADTTDIRSARFRAVLRGYDRREVDAFVDSADLKAASLQRDLSRMESLLTEHREKERSLQSALVSAEAMANQIRDRAQQDAQEIVRNAKAEAEHCIQTARYQADEIRRHAEQLRIRRHDAASSLEAIIGSLTSTLESVRVEGEHEAFVAPSMPEPEPARIQAEPESVQTGPDDAGPPVQPETHRFNPSRALDFPELVLPAPADWARASSMKPAYEQATGLEPVGLRTTPLRQLVVWVAAGVTFVALLLYLGLGRFRDRPVTTAAAPTTAARQAASGPAIGTAGAAPSGQPAALESTARTIEAGDELLVELRSKTPSWVGITVDGERVASRVMNAGEQSVLRARDEVVLRVGDAGALVVTINGEPARPLGEPGQVVTARIDRSNYRSLIVAK